MKTLPPAFEALRPYNQFIAYKLVPDAARPGKMHKKPVNPHTGLVADPHDPKAWATFEQAQGVADGVGFVFTAADPFFFIDIDHCTVGGLWSPLALELMQEAYGCAIEVSQSGEGLHIIGVGEAPGHGCKNVALGLELYTEKRFVALTGNQATGDAGARCVRLPNIAATYFPASAPSEAFAWVEKPYDGWDGHTDDLDLIEHALSTGGAAAAFGDKAAFRHLWAANSDALSRAYPDEHGDRAYDASSADAALAQHLAFWTGKDCGRIERLMLKSELVRDKWDREDYLRRTIQNACARCSQMHIRKKQPKQNKSYSELLDEAQDFHIETEPSVIENTIRDSSNLSLIECQRVHDKISETTGLTKTEIRKTQRAISNKQDDDLTHANNLIECVSSQNIFSTESNLFLWNDTGVWKKQEDRAIKQLVQNYIEGRVQVRKSKVDSISDVLKNKVYRSDQKFNLGPPESVNCLNGELSLNNHYWGLMPHNRDYYRTTQIPVTFESSATAPYFDKFMRDIFNNEEDLLQKRAAILEMIGYTLMTHCNHEKFIILVGNGANGKSVLLSVIEALCGQSNIAGVQPSQFDSSFKRAHLHGKLANIVTEIKQGEVIDDASLKGIVSGEPTSVEHKFRDPFVMRPYATCWFGTNHLPHTRDFSDAVFRRALVIQFNHSFKPEYGNCDPNLKNKLMQELPGILNLALNAYSNALVNGFTTPASSISAANEWRLEADQVAQFVEDKCQKVPGSSVPCNFLFDIYKNWVIENGIRQALGIKSFRERLTRLKFGTKRTSGSRLVTGISLKIMTPVTGVTHFQTLHEEKNIN